MRRTVLPRGGASARALVEIEDSMASAWAVLRGEYPGDERALAEVVWQDPREFDWRVVDVAMDLLTCPVGHVLGAGPLGCEPCAVADGYRYLGREVDRAKVPGGNEHGLRVAAAVARNRHRFTPRARTGYELALPELLAGRLPTVEQAQAAKAVINRLGDATLDGLTGYEQVFSR